MNDDDQSGNGVSPVLAVRGREDGTVLLSRPDGPDVPAVFVAELELDGARLVYDARDLSGPVRVELAEPAAALSWLAAVGGPRLAEAARRVTTAQELEVPWQDDIYGGTAARLAFADWLAVRYPTSAERPRLDLEALAVERADLVLQLYLCLTDAERVAAARLDDGSRVRAGELLRWAEQPTVTVVTPFLPALRRVAELMALTEWSPQVAVTGESAQGYTGADHPDGVSGAGGTASIDWTRVPPHVLDAAEDTVTWQVAGDRLAVQVRAAPGGPRPDVPGGPLLARAYVPDVALPLAVVELAVTEEGYAGSGRLLVIGDLDRLRVDVVARELAAPPVPLERLAVAAAVRQEVRELVDVRLGSLLVGGPPAPGVAPYLAELVTAYVERSIVDLVGQVLDRSDLLERQLSAYTLVVPGTRDVPPTGIRGPAVVRTWSIPDAALTQRLTGREQEPGGQGPTVTVRRQDTEVGQQLTVSVYVGEVSPHSPQAAAVIEWDGHREAVLMELQIDEVYGSGMFTMTTVLPGAGPDTDVTVHVAAVESPR